MIKASERWKVWSAPDRQCVCPAVSNRKLRTDGTRDSLTAVERGALDAEQMKALCSTLRAGSRRRSELKPERRFVETRGERACGTPAATLCP